jgi:hypothetical protein
VHIGDILHDEGDVYGDGVNIAARLEALADPGGIVVSGTAYDMLKSQVEVGYRFLGDKRLKNIERPVRVYQVTAVDAAPPPRFSRRTQIAGVLAVCLVITALGWFWTRPDFTPVDPSMVAMELPATPSIAVLPFDLRGDASSPDWVADAITESIISTLSL